jgi:cytochrome c553
MKANVLSAVVALLTLLAGIGEAADKGAVPDLVTRVCSTCHGAQGMSISSTFPNLAGQQVVYLETQLKAFRDHSRADPHAQAFMWGMAAQLTDSTIAEIAAYYGSQPPAPGKPAGSAEMAAGKKIFDEGIQAQQVPPCQSCHGAEAKGNGPFPRLAGQHRTYLEKQLEAFAVNLRANEIMHQNSKGLTALQISELAAYLSSR